MAFRCVYVNRTVFFFTTRPPRRRPAGRADGELVNTSQFSSRRLFGDDPAVLVFLGKEETYLRARYRFIVTAYRVFRNPILIRIRFMTSIAIQRR